MPRPPRHKPKKQADTEKAEALRFQRVKELTGEGLYGKACKALVANGPVPHTADTEADLRAKHPTAERPPDLPAVGAPNPGLVPEFGGGLVNKMTRSFARGTAPGPSGL